MAIPLVSNVGFTEVTQSLVDSNSGVLNDIAGSRINLPIQYFKLGENISGNLTLNNVNKKLLHFVGVLQNKEGELAAIFETVLGHINLDARKVTEFDDKRLTDLLTYQELNTINDQLPFELRLKIKDLDDSKF